MFSTVSASLISAGEQTNGQVSATEAAPFIGEWTLALDGPNGPGTFGLSVKLEKDKVSAELVSETVGTSAITSITKADKTLALSYSFLYEGNPVDAVIRLTPGSDGRTTAQIDFAGGAYVMSGTATRKEKAK
jgi:hypothetical protein